MTGRPVRLSVALSISEYAALDWYADRLDIPTSSLARELMREALLPRLQEGTPEGSAYAQDMEAKKQQTIAEEENG